MHRSAIAVTCLSFGFVLTGCGGGGTTTPAPAPVPSTTTCSAQNYISSTGTLNATVTMQGGDAPICCQAVANETALLLNDLPEECDATKWNVTQYTAEMSINRGDCSGSRCLVNTTDEFRLSFVGLTSHCCDVWKASYPEQPSECIPHTDISSYCEVIQFGVTSVQEDYLEQLV